jgi:hypothetical protein
MQNDNNNTDLGYENTRPKYATAMLKTKARPKAFSRFVKIL